MGDRVCECGHGANDHVQPRPSLSPYAGPPVPPGICIVCPCAKFRDAGEMS